MGISPVEVTQKRRFRLAPLEAILLVLVLLVAGYLVVIGLRRADPPQSPRAVGPLPSGAQLEKALAAAEKATAELSVLKTGMAALKKEMGGLASQKVSKLAGRIERLEKVALKIRRPLRAGAPAAPALEHRVMALEEMIKKGSVTSRAGAPAASAELMMRIKNLEEQVKSLPPPESPQASAAMAARVERLERNLAQVAAKAGVVQGKKNPMDDLFTRMSRLEAKVGQSAGVNPLAHPQLLAKLEALEKGSKAINEIISLRLRIESLEKLLANKAKGPEVPEGARPGPDSKIAARLDTLESALAAAISKVAAMERDAPKPGTGPGGARLADKVNNLEKAVIELARGRDSNTDPDHRLVSRLAKLEKALSDFPPQEAALSARVAKLEQEEAPGGAAATLDRRIAALERSFATVTQVTNQAQSSGVELTRRMGKWEEKIGSTAALNKRLAYLTQKAEDLAVAQQILAGQMGRMAGRAGMEVASAGASRGTTAKSRSQNKVKARPVRKAKTPRPRKKPESIAKRPALSAASPKGMRIQHKVKRGDTLYSLARRYRVTVNQIRAWNPKMAKRRYLWVGESLLVSPRR